MMGKTASWTSDYRSCTIVLFGGIDINVGVITEIKGGGLVAFKVLWDLKI